MSLKKLDQEINEQWGSYWDTMKKASIGKKLLIVEGEDDKTVVEQLLASVDRVWATKVHVGAAGGRAKVLSKLNDNPDWFGLVDRDVWDDAQVFKKKAALPKLVVTSGWCMENHFCHPVDVESALSLAPGTIQAELDQVLDNWLWYGAIRWTLQRVRDGINWPPSDLGHPIQNPCGQDVDARELRAQLQSSPGLFNPRDVEGLITAIRARKGELDALPDRDKIETGVHGKEFFNEVIVRALSRKRSQQHASVWRGEVAVQWQARWPAYLVAFAQRLVA